MSSLAEDIAATITAHKALPEMPALTIEQAYDLQPEVARMVSPAGFAGIKAGVTAAPLQKMFNVDFSLLGRLYASGRLGDGSTLAYRPGRLIECELACYCDANGTLLAVAPAIEFACVTFAAPEQASAANLIAANVAAEKFLVGEPCSFSESMELPILKLYRDDELVNEAHCADSLDGPRAATQWIMQEAKQRHFEIAAENLLMTGACGQVIPAEPGEYRAEYGDLGRLSFLIEK